MGLESNGSATQQVSQQDTQSDLEGTVPRGWHDAIRSLRSFLVSEMFPRTPGVHCCVYGIPLYDADRHVVSFRLEELVFDGAVNKTVQNDAASLALLGAATEFLETYRSHDPSIHAEAREKLRVVIKQPNPLEIQDAMRSILKKADARPDDPVWKFMAHSWGGNTFLPVRQVILNLVKFGTKTP